MRDALTMGRLTAHATHEMQNILATIRESSGLMEDLLAMDSEGFAHAERFKKGLAVLAEQVERGMALSEQLNYCAHSPEAQAAGADVNEAVRAWAGLARRQAARSRVSLGFSPGRQGLRTALRGVEIMGLLSLALDCALSLLKKGAALALSVEEQGGLSVVRFGAPEHAALAGAEGYPRLAEEARTLGVGLGAGPGGRGLALALPLPAA